MNILHNFFKVNTFSKTFLKRFTYRQFDQFPSGFLLFYGTYDGPDHVRCKEELEEANEKRKEFSILSVLHGSA